jgi:hypothetical protein
VEVGRRGALRGPGKAEREHGADNEDDAGHSMGAT